jgi:hypothetical protein
MRTLMAGLSVARHEKTTPHLRNLTATLALFVALGGTFERLRERGEFFGALVHCQPSSRLLGGIG